MTRLGKDGKMAKGLYTGMLDLIGRTPLVELRRITPPSGARILAKLEGANPTGSVKDRIALAMVEAAESSGLLKPSGVILEPSSGNTAVSLALVAGLKGYRLIILAPDVLPQSRRQILSHLGAQLHLTPGHEGMAGANVAAEELARKTDHVWLNQFANPATVEVHRRSTAQEILEDTEGHIEALVAGVGTGGTLTGVGEVLKAYNDGIRVIAVEPATSPLLSAGRAGPHGIPGLGANFVPPALNRDIIDRVHPVLEGSAAAMTLRLAREEGLLVGLSSGAALDAALETASQMPSSATVVVIFPDAGPKHLPPPLP